MVSLFRRLFPKNRKPAPAASGVAVSGGAGPQAGVRSGSGAASVVVATGPVRRPLAAGGGVPIFRLSEVTMERPVAAVRSISGGSGNDQSPEAGLKSGQMLGGFEQDRGSGGKQEADSPPLPALTPSPEGNLSFGEVPELKTAPEARQVAVQPEAGKLPLLPPVSPIQPIALKAPPVSGEGPEVAVVEMSLRAALRDADAAQLGFSPAEVPGGVVLRLPLALVRPQLAMGKVEIGLEDLRQGVLEANRPAFDCAAPDLRIVVPLSELFPLLPADIIPMAGEPEMKTEMENAADPGGFGGPPWAAGDDDFMIPYCDPGGELSDAPPPLSPPSVEVPRPMLEPVAAAPVPVEAPCSGPPPATFAPTALPSPPPAAGAGAVSAGISALPALPPLVRRNAGMFSRPPGSSLPPAAPHSDGRDGESAGNLPRITPLPLLSNAPTLPTRPAPPAVPALSAPLPLPVEIPTPQPTLTVLTDCGNLPGDEDDLGQPYPAGALTAEPPFPGRNIGSKSNPTARPTTESPPATVLPPVDAEGLKAPGLQQPPSGNPQPSLASVTHPEMAASAPLPANPAPLPALPALPPLVPLQAALQSTAPSLSALPVQMPAPAAHVPADEFEDLSFGCVADSTQLTLRAIFGSDQRMTAQEVINHCARLSGLRACVLLRRGAAPLHSDGLTEAEIETFVRRAAQTSELIFALGGGSGEKDEGADGGSTFTLRSDGGVQSFFIAGNLCLAVWHREATFSAGVREKLILAAQELVSLAL